MDIALETAPPPAFSPELARRTDSEPRTPGWDPGTERRLGDGRTLATQVGWLSVGLGVADLVAGHRFARWAGTEKAAPLFRLYGLREIACGVGMLTSRRPLGWVRGRIAGDMLDLASLAVAVGRGDPNRRNVTLMAAAIAGVAALDLLCERQLSASMQEAAELRAQLH